MQKWKNKLLFFVGIGVVLAVLIAGIILLSYLFIFGALIGLALFVIAWVRDTFFSSKTISTDVKRESRTIDHDDVK